MIECRICDKYNVCKHICSELHHYLNDVTQKYSLKSNYLVKFVNPMLVETLIDIRYKKPSIDKINVSKSIDYYKLIKNKIHVLTEIEEKCLSLYYGLKNYEYNSQNEIAKFLSISQHSVYHHLKNARRKIKLSLCNSRMIFKIYNNVKGRINAK